jgi:hypothetical protein
MEKKLVDEQALTELLNSYLTEYAEHGENTDFEIEEHDGTNWRIGTVRGKLGSAERRLVDKVYEQAKKNFNVK